MNFISKIEELKETFEEEQARKQAAIQAMLDWAKAVHCRSTEDWTREELYDEDLNNGQVVEGVPTKVCVQGGACASWQLSGWKHRNCGAGGGLIYN